MYKSGSVLQGQHALIVTGKHLHCAATPSDLCGIQLAVSQLSEPHIGRLSFHSRSSIVNTMNTAFILLILCGCVGVSICQTTCTETVRLQTCASTYNTAIMSAGANYQARCEAARQLTDCFYGQDECLTNELRDTYNNAQMTQNNPPCSDVMASGSAAVAVHVSTLLFVTFLLFFT